jgi:hypothetical protein
METLNEVPDYLQVYLHYVYRDYKEKPVDSYCTFEQKTTTLSLQFSVVDSHIKIVSSTYKEIVTIPVERFIVVFLIFSSQVVVYFLCYQVESLSI